MVSSSRDLPTTHRYDGATPTKKLSGLPPLGCFSLFFMGNARRPEALSRRPSRSGIWTGRRTMQQKVYWLDYDPVAAYRNRHDWTAHIEHLTPSSKPEAAPTLLPNGAGTPPYTLALVGGFPHPPPRIPAVAETLAVRTMSSEIAEERKAS